MKKILISGVAAASLAALALSIALAATPEGVPYPANYRQWTHVKSMVIEPGHALHASFGGIHHLYANDAALKGYRDGRFPDGAVIAFEIDPFRRHRLLEGLDDIGETLLHAAEIAAFERAHLARSPWLAKRAER